MCDVSIKVITWNRVIVFHPNLEFRHLIDNATSLLRLFAIACVSLRFVAQIIGNTEFTLLCEFAASFDIVQFAAKFDMQQFILCANSL